MLNQNIVLSREVDPLLFMVKHMIFKNLTKTKNTKIRYTRIQKLMAYNKNFTTRTRRKEITLFLTKNVTTGLNKSITEFIIMIIEGFPNLTIVVIKTVKTDILAKNIR